MTKYYKFSILLLLNITFNNALIHSSYYKNHRNTSFNATLPNYRQHSNHQAIPQQTQQHDDSVIMAQSYQPYINSQAISQRIQQANDQRTNNIIAIATQKAQSMALYNQPFSKQIIIDYCKAQIRPINEPIINDYLKRISNDPNNLDDVLQKAYSSMKSLK